MLCSLRSGRSAAGVSWAGTSPVPRSRRQVYSSARHAARPARRRPISAARPEAGGATSGVDDEMGDAGDRRSLTFKTFPSAHGSSLHRMLCDKVHAAQLPDAPERVKRVTSSPWRERRSAPRLFLAHRRAHHSPSPPSGGKYESKKGRTEHQAARNGLTTVSLTFPLSRISGRILSRVGGLKSVDWLATPTERRHHGEG